MDTYQQNKLTMLQAVGRYLAEGGASLAAIKRIGAGTAALAAAVARIETAVKQQGTPTTGTTRSREEVKAEAAGKAEVLRLLIVALSADVTLRASVQEAVSRHLHDKDAELLRYLVAKDLAESGYDAAVLTTLLTDLKLLTDTQVATRQIQIGTAGAIGALPDLLAEADAVLDQQLDPLVRAQKLAQSAAVAGYDQARRIVRTAARRRPRFGGTVAPGAVARPAHRATAVGQRPTNRGHEAQPRVIGAQPRVISQCYGTVTPLAFSTPARNSTW